MARTAVKIRYRKDRGVWEVDYRDRSGRRHRPLFASEEEAHEHATEILRSADQEIHARQATITPPTMTASVIKARSARE